MRFRKNLFPTVYHFGMGKGIINSRAVFIEEYPKESQTKAQIGWNF
ncbi:MAG: hypothetical protein ACK5RV_03710 [Flavobacterium sp.]|nr:hypothetical protein [Flavobacterium sp.]MCZ8169447.1 hypothetical protein [Flavobacterium sp.]MCZ8296827.1 hypothetical protein [Flavobacterium sp.]